MKPRPPRLYLPPPIKFKPLEKIVGAPNHEETTAANSKPRRAETAANATGAASSPEGQVLEEEVSGAERVLERDR